MKSTNPPAEESGPVTVQQVARAAGVSPATVSRILSGRKRVSPETREAVERAIAQLKFEPNVLAQSLKRGSSRTVGVLTQDVGSPFFSELLRGIESALEGTGYESLIASGHWKAADEVQRARRLIARRVDGVVVLTGPLTDAQLLPLSEQVPIVSTSSRLRSPRAVGLMLDNEAGGYLATRHLLDLGHHRIAHIVGRRDHPDAEERLAGYRRALQEAGLPIDERLILEGDYTEASGVLALNRLLHSGAPFTAIFAANDQTAYGVRLALYRLNIRVPDDVSLVGFDDLPGSLYTTPPLTTVRQPLFEVGRMAAQAMLQLLEGKPVELSAPPLQLVVRETTRRLAAPA